MPPNNWENGVIVTSDDEVVAKPGMTLAELVNTKAARNAIRLYPPNEQVRFEPFLIDGNPCMGCANFMDGRLAYFMLALTDDGCRKRFGFVPPSGTNGEHQQFYEAWLAATLGDRHA